MLDVLIDDMARRFGLGERAGRLVREALALIIGSQGGISAFLDTLKSAGLASEVSSWLGDADAAPLTAHETERALGPGVLGRIANRLDLRRPVSTALGYAVPRLIGLLTPNGVVPTSLPAEATNFLSREGSLAGSPRSASMTTKRQMRRHRDVLAAGPAGPLLGVLILLGLGWYFWPMSIGESRGGRSRARDFARASRHDFARSHSGPRGSAGSGRFDARFRPHDLLPDSKEGPVATTVPASAPAPAAAPSPVSTPVPATTGPAATSTPVATPAPASTTPLDAHSGRDAAVDAHAR